MLRWQTALAGKADLRALVDHLSGCVPRKYVVDLWWLHQRSCTEHMKSCEECETTESMLIDTIYTLLPFMCICSVVEQTWTTWILSSCWRCTWLRRTQHDVSLVKLLVYGWRKPGFISWTKQDGPDKYGQPMCIKTINAGCCWESSDHRIENNFITIDRPSDKQPCGQQFVRRHHSLPKSIGVPLKTPGSFSKTWGNAKSIPSLLS